MILPNFIYRSERIGKNGRRFSLYKIRTLREGFTGNYAGDDSYTRFGKFLRHSKLDELPQLLNVLKGDTSLVGPRPENYETIDVLPREIRKIILSVKPGLTSLASIHFSDEEKILQVGKNNNYDYYAKIKPIKVALDVFYVQNKCLSLDLVILWMTFKLMIKKMFGK